jgi:DNA invertase Pin-like site-specific DNA recombinase
MRVAIYCRVSTDKQELEQQIEACKKFCEYKKWEYVVFSDIMSGKTMQRPQFLDLIERARKFEFTGIVVFRFDRIGRNAREVVTLLEEFENKGIMIISINENIDTSNPIGKAVRDIIIRLAQLERENISVATRQRLQAKRDIGEHFGRRFGSKDKKKRKTDGYKKRWEKRKYGFEKTNKRLGLKGGVNKLEETNIKSDEINKIN